MLLPDGVYRKTATDGAIRFVPVPAPSVDQLAMLVRTIAERIGRSLERAGLLTRDMENAYLAFDPSEEAPINTLLGHSITYRIATERLTLTDSGHIRYSLKTAYRDGTTHVIFEPEDFIARLAALVPKPRAHLTRYHGVFAPNSALRGRVVARAKAGASPSIPQRTEAHRHRAMSWAKRLKRVFAIDIETCRRCGGKLEVIASIEEQPVIDRILEHLGGAADALDLSHPSRGPPVGELPL